MVALALPSVIVASVVNLSVDEVNRYITYSVAVIAVLVVAVHVVIVV